MGQSEIIMDVDDEPPKILYRNKEVRLKFSDEHSGYRESRYGWTQSQTCLADPDVFTIW